MVRGGKREPQPQTVAAGLQFPRRRGVARLLAYFRDPPNAPPPCLDHSGAEECVGDSRVMRLGRKFPSELIGGPFRRQLHRIPDHDPVIMHANLNRRGAGVVPVNDGVDHRFAHGFARHGKGLHAVNAVVGNQRLRVLRVQQVHRLIDLSEQVALDNVLIQQLRTTEIADLHIGFHHESVWRWMKEQDRGALQETGLPQLEPFDHPFIRFAQDVPRQAFAVGTPLAKSIQHTAIQVLEADVRLRHVVPGSAVFLQQKTAKRRASEHLLGAAAPIVEFAFVADWIGVGINRDFQILPAVFRLQVHVHHDAQQRLRLVGDFFKQPENAFHSNHLAPIILADLQYAALRVGEAANPFQVFVPPRPFPFDVLAFIHVASSLYPSR